jgi:protein involved in polysaccharide export with SLBB domain
LPGGAGEQAPEFPPDGAESFETAGEEPMHSSSHSLSPLPIGHRHPNLSVLTRAAGLACSLLMAGCAALTNPGVQAVPVRLLPDCLRGQSREGLQPIPLSLLGQPRPAAYRVGPGDTLGVWIEGVLGEPGQQPPVLTPVQLDNVGLPPATGFPLQVRGDGTLSLPLIEPLNVNGLTLLEVEAAIRRAYSLTHKILKTGRERILVTLVRPRTVHVLVLRQDSPTPVQTVVTTSLGLGAPEYIGVARKGTGWDLVLPAYHNDVLTALARSGGLPGTDAIDAVIIERNGQNSRGWEAAMQDFQAHGGPSPVPGAPILRIPLRVKPGTPLPFRPEDITLQDGDVVFVPAREERVFYTAGLMPPGEHILPRDHDLDVLEAVSRSRGPMFNGAFAVSNLSGTVIQPGLGQPNPSLLTVIRKLPCGGTIPIRVDLNRAVCDPRERLLVEAGDLLILQETPGQAITRYTTQMFDLTFLWKYALTSRLFGVGGFSIPGGTAPTTITPLNITTSSNFSQTAGVGSSGITPLTTTNSGSTTVTPTPLTPGR